HYGRVTAHSDLDIGTSAAGLTIEMWVKPQNVGSRDATLLHWGLPGSTDGVQVLQYDNGGRSFTVNLKDTSNGDHSMEVGFVFASDTWVHVAYTYDRTTGLARIHKNGVLQQESNLGIFTPRTTNTLFIGTHRDGG